jgi:predicted DNA-binding protein
VEDPDTDHEGAHVLRLESATVACHEFCMTARPQRNFHVPMAEPTYRKLRAEAERSKRPATGIAREAIETWLAERERMAVHEAIGAYALRMAGTGADLDTPLEGAAVEALAPRRKAPKR